MGNNYASHVNKQTEKLSCEDNSAECSAIKSTQCYSVKGHYKGVFFSTKKMSPSYKVH